MLARDAVLCHVVFLSTDERAVVHLRYWADMTLEDVAALLDLPAGTVKSQLHRALSRMRAAAAPEEVTR